MHLCPLHDAQVHITLLILLSRLTRPHSTTTIPGPNKYCTKTPTATSYLPCQTSCRAGCATYTSTEMTSPSCPSTSIPNPVKPTLSLTLTTKPKPTITSPPRSRPCYTETVTASNKCPEDDLGCPPPDCIWLSTTLVPSGPVEGCCATPTLTRSRSCKGACNGACATQWVTETVTGWGAR
ncbi:hypothetical protein K505DRAFT_163230 [Melanomma pulvis-pyrius CBS 109.77]|uniref:Uncharacterized protein n=1 Tax=Melanomma pulvis-pyrius CBS 109.77 TaxID=1314802 RepID=A0A6A6XJZ0_9PLEO|nr:hypothetical protein K505DRAFT_163230 [Melanomma pulvis-pyrius CBS 109.77]